MKRKRTALLQSLSLAAAGMLLCYGNYVYAHHSFAMFDMTHPKSISGVVKEFQWTNPHVWLFLAVDNGAGVNDIWGFEGMSPSILHRFGWDSKTLKTGDHVVVLYRPLKTGEKGGSFIHGTMDDGTVYRMLPKDAEDAMLHPSGGTPADSPAP